MRVREGIIPAVLGTIVSGTGATMTKKKITPLIAAGILGFGLAHIVLGSIDLVEHRKE